MLSWCPHPPKKMHKGESRCPPNLFSQITCVRTSDKTPQHNMFVLSHALIFPTTMCRQEFCSDIRFLVWRFSDAQGRAFHHPCAPTSRKGAIGEANMWITLWHRATSNSSWHVLLKLIHRHQLAMGPIAADASKNQVKQVSANQWSQNGVSSLQ